jgi:hypothetical protein
MVRRRNLFSGAGVSAYALVHCTDDDVRLLRHAALALCLAPRLVREMRPVSGEGGQAGMKRVSHNDRVTKIAWSRSKLVDLKAKREICLIIANRLTYLS